MPMTGPSVLHGLTFEVKSGERVGVGEHSIESDHRKMADCLFSRSNWERKGVSRVRAYTEFTSVASRVL